MLLLQCSSTSTEQDQILKGLNQLDSVLRHVILTTLHLRCPSLHHSKVLGKLSTLLELGRA